MRHRHIRDAIVAVLSALDPTIGPVHAYQRHANTQADLKAFYTTDSTFTGWFVERLDWKQSAATLATNALSETWQITGFMALDDEDQSELAFHDCLDRILAAFNDDETLQGTVSGIREVTAGIQLARAEPVMFAGVLCHRAVLRLTTLSHVALPQGDDPQVKECLLGMAPDIGLGHEADYQPLGGDA